MEIQVTEIEPFKFKVNYQADAEQILNKRAEVLNAFKKAPVPGFLKGHAASTDAIKMHYRHQIEESLKRALAEDAYHNTIFEKKFRPHGAPMFNTLSFLDGKFSCEFDLYTKPDFALKEFKNMEIPKPHEPASVEEVAERMLQELRVRAGEVSQFVENDFVQEGDSVIVDYVATLDGVKVDQLSGEGQMLCIGKGLKSFDDNLLGMSAGETRDFNLVIPDDGLPSLSGKTVNFSCTLLTGSKTTPCALDDSLAVKVGKKDFNELKEFIVGNAQAQIQNKFKTDLNNAICTRLVNDNQFEVPGFMSLSEAQYLCQQSNLKWDELNDQDRERFLEMAANNCRLSLILDFIRESTPDAQLTEQEVFNIVKQHLAANKANGKIKEDLDSVIKDMDKSGQLQILFARIKDQVVLEWLVKNVRVVE